jgi:hypothetical protein
LLLLLHISYVLQSHSRIPISSQVVATLLEIGNLKITIKGPQVETYTVPRQLGSIYSLGGNITLDIDEGSRVAFIFIMFKMRP